MRIRAILLFLVSILFCTQNLTGVIKAEEERIIFFSGQEWVVESSSQSKVGPGDNYFSHSIDTVWTDEDGWLHLRIRKEEGLDKWVCSSVHSILPADYGFHRFYVVSDLEHLDRNVVLGLFFYRIDPQNPMDGSEFDIEFSSWGLPKKLPDGKIQAADNNMQYVLWKPWKSMDEPKIAAMSCHTIITGAGQCTTHTLKWMPDSLQFYSCYGHLKQPKPENMIHYWFIQSSLANPLLIPQKNDQMHIVLNLWMNQNVAFPSDQKEVEVLVKYEYESY